MRHSSPCGGGSSCSLCCLHCPPPSPALLPISSSTLSPGSSSCSCSSPVWSFHIWIWTQHCSPTTPGHTRHAQLLSLWWWLQLLPLLPSLPPSQSSPPTHQFQLMFQPTL